MYQANLEVVKVSALQLFLEFMEFPALLLFSYIGLSHVGRVYSKHSKAGQRE